MTYLRYRPDIEQLEANEQETIDGIIKGMTQQSETVEQRERHAVRASHAKSSKVTRAKARGTAPFLADSKETQLSP